jgi:hypothetical protein
VISSSTASWPRAAAEGSGLDEGERAHGLGPARGDEQRDDCAVGVPDEMGAIAEQRGDVVGIDLEVGRAVRGASAVAATVGQHQRARFGQRALCAKRERAPRQTAVDADDALAVAPHDDVDRTGSPPVPRPDI